MGIKINGADNTIKKTISPGVFICNSLIINGTKYEWPADAGDIPPTPIEPDPDVETYLTTSRTFELWSPSQTDSSTDNIPITKDTQGGSLGEIYWIANYDVQYADGTTTYKADMYFTVDDKTTVYDPSGNAYETKSIGNGRKTTTRPLSLWDYQVHSIYGYSGEHIKTVTFEYLEKKATSLSLKTESLEEVKTCDNLLVNSSVLISNNLGVYGYINEIFWNWDTLYVDIPLSAIGFGMLAQFYDSKYTINGTEYELPFFQLSPGLSYITDNIIVSWLADGQLLLQSTTSDPITNISFAPRILRYE